MIKGDKISLRPVREKDLDKLYSILCKDFRFKGDFYPINLLSESAYKDYFKISGFWNDDYGQLLMVKNDNENEFLGHICCYKVAIFNDCLEIGSILYKSSSRHKGIGSEALKLFVDFLFKTKTINRLQVVIMPENIAAIKSVENVGFKFEGILRGIKYHKGKYNDMKIFSLLHDEYMNRKKK